MAAGLGLLRAHRVPDQAAALRHQARELGPACLAPDDGERDSGESLELYGVRCHRLSLAHGAHAGFAVCARPTGTIGMVLFFELFPAFLAVVSLIVGLVLFLADRQAARDPDHHEKPRVKPAPVTPEQAAAERRSNQRRPSMSP